jgi:hypothetical protein
MKEVAMQTPHGVWDRMRHGEFAATFTLLVQAAPNNLVFVSGESLGKDKLRLRITVDGSGDSFSGDFVSEARGANGAVVFGATGTVVGTRLQLEPLP